MPFLPAPLGVEEVVREQLRGARRKAEPANAVEDLVRPHAGHSGECTEHAARNAAARCHLDAGKNHHARQGGRFGGRPPSVYYSRAVQGRRQKNLVLILAREFASKLATPMFVADADGNLVFYNEPAEIILGRTFAEAGEMPAEDWADLFQL